MTDEKIDSPSNSGQFGWERIGNEDFAIPVIVRGNGIRFAPVRVVEQEIIKRYDTLPESIFQFITLTSFHITHSEAKLLNDINFNHCNNRYGESHFSTADVIISSSDMKELSRYLNVSVEIFSGDLSRVAANFGIIRMLAGPAEQTDGVMLVPYLTKSCKGKLMRFIPTKLVESFVTISPNSIRSTPNDWDIIYLKMLCIHSENNMQQYITRDIHIILLDGLMYKKTNTPISFEDYRAPLQNSANNWPT